MMEGMTEENFELLGGALCLDFANTVHQYGAPDPQDDLRDFDDLRLWGLQTGTWPARGGVRGSLADLRRAKQARDLIYRVLSKLAAGKDPASQDLDKLNHHLAQALSQRKLGWSDKGATWTWTSAKDPVDLLLWRVFDSCATLLTSHEWRRIRECGSATCTWLFLDQSKNGTRRWCDMKRCGNREKSRRHYARVRHGS